MRYPKDQKERTRLHIEQVAARVIRRDGIAATAILPVMREAGMTQGAFYKIFRSRDALIGAALMLATAETRTFVAEWTGSARAVGEAPIGRIIDEYLSERHVESAERGCIFATLAPELARQSEPVLVVARQCLVLLCAMLAAELDVRNRDMAEPILLLMASAVSIARLSDGVPERRRVLEDARRAARVLAGVSG